MINLPSPICHMIIIINESENKALFSMLDYSFPISFIHKHASVETIYNVIEKSIYDLSCRVSCVGHYKEIYSNPLNRKEFIILNNVMSNESLIQCSNQLHIHHKTALNYRTSAIYKAFKRLDVRSFRIYFLYILLKEGGAKKEKDNYISLIKTGCPARKIST